MFKINGNAADECGYQMEAAFMHKNASLAYEDA